MSVEMSVSSSQGRPAEFHDKRVYTPNNADPALVNSHERWIDPGSRTDEMVFNELFQPDVDKFNAKQSRPCRKMGDESTSTERQKSYYAGIVDGTFCFGSGKQQESPIEEIVIQFGNKDDNGVTDPDFDIQHWYDLKARDPDAASKYVQEHLSDAEQTERAKRILHRSVDRIAAIDPEHIVVFRADYHGDEPCGTPHAHLGVIFRATGYKNGMESRVACVKALEQAGFKKTKDKEYGIVQLHERIKDIIEEEMEADALEYGYEPIQRKADSGEHRKHSDVDAFRQMAAEQEKLEDQKLTVALLESYNRDVQAKLKVKQEEQEAVAKEQADNDLLLKRKNKHIRNTLNFIYGFLQDMGDNRRFNTYQEMQAAIVSAKERFVTTTQDTANQKAQDKAAADFQVKEDQLEAQRLALEQQFETRAKKLDHDYVEREKTLSEDYASREKKLEERERLVSSEEVAHTPVGAMQYAIKLFEQRVNSEQVLRVTSSMQNFLRMNKQQINDGYKNHLAKIHEQREAMKRSPDTDGRSKSIESQFQVE